MVIGRGPGGSVKPLTGPGPGLTILYGTTPTGFLTVLMTVQVSKHIQAINLFHCLSLFSISNHVKHIIHYDMYILSMYGNLFRISVYFTVLVYFVYKLSVIHIC